MNAVINDNILILIKQSSAVVIGLKIFYEKR